MPTPLKPLGKKFRLKLERLSEAVQAGRANGPRIEGALWGKKMRRKLERLAANPEPVVRPRPSVDETVEKIVERQGKFRKRPVAAVDDAPRVRVPARRKPSRAGKRKRS